MKRTEKEEIPIPLKEENKIEPHQIEKLIENKNPNPEKSHKKANPKRPRVPKASDLNKIDHHEPKNYLNKNAIEAINAETEKVSGKKEITAKAINPSYGKVPEYLNKMKEESLKKAEEEYIATLGKKLKKPRKRQRVRDSSQKKKELKPSKT